MSDAIDARLPATNEPLRIAVRRLHWFRRAFAEHVEATGRRIGCSFALDEAVLTGVFVRWLREVNRQKPASKAERLAFFEFAAGLMLRELTRTMPIRAEGPARLAPEDSAAAFWPEGWACTTFCVTLLSAATEQEFHAHPRLADAFEDLRQWWSFRENAAIDASFAAGFLQLVLGHEPNWMMPDVFRLRLERDLSTG